MLNTVSPAAMTRRTLLGASLPATASLSWPPAHVVSPARDPGQADDTLAMVRALASAKGGAVLIPPGTWTVQPNRLQVPPSTSLFGLGRGSVLRRSGPGTLLQFSGASTEQRVSGCLVRDLVLDGNHTKGTLVRIEHASDIVFDNVWSCFNDGIGLDASELWDSRFVNCTWDWCSGRNNNSPAVRLRNRGENDASVENTNAVIFLNCRWESFRDGAVWLQRAGPAQISQIHFDNCKMETSFVRGPFLKLSTDARNISVSNLYLCGNSFDAGWDRPVNLIEFSPFAQARLRDLSVWLNKPVARAVVCATAGHASSCSINNIWVDGPFRPELAIVEDLSPVPLTVQQIGFLSGPDQPGATISPARN